VSTTRQSLGRWGEALAAEYLESQGFVILTHNIRTPYGELDLVARETSPQGDEIVFVEVKTRRSHTYGFPEQSVTLKKKEHLMKSAQAFLVDHPELAGTWRIDVVAILRDPDDSTTAIEHFKNAVS
jgi:putative endonuclease